MASLNIDLQHLQQCFLNYSNILKAKADTLNKEKKKILIELDDWYQNKLPAAINERQTKCIKHDELCKLMQWKLTRGKFRPRLTELVKSNEAEQVECVSSRAFKQLPDVITAMKTLTTLKAVGPATASAILAAVLPEKVPFMADESMIYALPNRPKMYTIPYFTDYMNAVSNIRKMFAKSDSKTIQTKWSAHQVELALWASSVASSLHFQVDVSLSNENTNREDGSPEKKKKKC
ncbi:uncharacterized protein LOC106872751 [Octopus bimaculoides]|uniref:Uncharacterized protein n=1 Tax=Octopus bimaculoides TaxID=37653 RepID=A0A0L8H4Z1_OCTBM|nr:uncharacterized protein LOC106872751 [Octopus bimaculoides]XP_014775330.1 uncharacterized protein LOC106872751 [Octopus bimaculoides]|eukprot:XP_014775329.1 PREDICTED: uncharacterized protein LOC106872751 [Octopus bimaculoides]